MDLKEIKERITGAARGKIVVGAVQNVTLQKTQASLKIVVDANDIDEITLNRGVELRFR